MQGFPKSGLGCLFALGPSKLRETGVGAEVQHVAFLRFFLKLWPVSLPLFCLCFVAVLMSLRAYAGHTCMQAFGKRHMHVIWGGAGGHDVTAFFAVCA